MKYLITQNQRDKVASKWMNHKFNPNQLEMVTDDRFPDSIFFKKDGKVFMEQDNLSHRFWVDDETIWKTFMDVFNYNYGEIQSFIKEWLKHNLNLGGYVVDIAIPRIERNWKELSN